MEVARQDDVHSCKGPQPPIAVVLPSPCLWDLCAEPVLSLAEERSIGEADLINDEPTPVRHPLGHIPIAGNAEVWELAKPKGVVNGLAAQVQAVYIAHHVEELLHKAQDVGFSSAWGTVQ